MNNFLLTILIGILTSLGVSAQQDSTLPVFGNPLVGGFELSKPFTDLKVELDYLAQALKESSNKVGVIVISYSKDLKRNKISFYRKRIRNYLLRVKGITADNLKFYDGSVKGKAKAVFYILPKVAIPHL